MRMCSVENLPAVKRPHSFLQPLPRDSETGPPSWVFFRPAHPAYFLLKSDWSEKLGYWWDRSLGCMNQGCTPRPAPTLGEMAALGRPGPENFQECPAPPHPENALGRTVTPPRPEHILPTPPLPEIFFLCPAPPRPEAKKAATCIPGIYSSLGDYEHGKMAK